MNKNVILVLDAIKDPQDMAQVIHFAISQDLHIIITGKSIPPWHINVSNIISSWLAGYQSDSGLLKKHVSVKTDYFKCMEKLKKDGYKLIGTSPNFGENLFTHSFGTDKVALIFGTESSGLSREKTNVLDGNVCVPMLNDTQFYTIGLIAPAIAFEAIRQNREAKR